MTPLFSSIINEKYDTLKIILEKYKDKVKKNITCTSGLTPLHLLCSREAHPLTEGEKMFLSSKDLKVNEQDKKRMNTPLHLAIFTCNIEIVKILLKNPNIDVNIQNSDKETPFSLALFFTGRNLRNDDFNDRLEIVKLILNMKKKVNILTKNQSVFFHLDFFY